MLRRPASLIAATVVATGLGLLHLGAVAPGALAMLIQGTPLPGEAAQHQDMFGYPMTWLLEHMVEWLALQGALGVLALLSGVGLWLALPWARRFSQMVMLTLVASWFTAGLILGVSLKAPAVGGAAAASFFMILRVAAVGVGAAWAALAALPTWLLERQDVRAWLEGRGRPTMG